MRSASSIVLGCPALGRLGRHLVVQSVQVLERERALVPVPEHAIHPSIQGQAEYAARLFRAVGLGVPLKPSGLVLGFQDQGQCLDDNRRGAETGVYGPQRIAGSHPRRSRLNNVEDEAEQDVGVQKNGWARRR